MPPTADSHKPSAALPRDQIARELVAHPQWEIVDDGTRIRRQFRMQNFLHGLQFFHRIGGVAEEENHHPDLHLTGYRHVTVELWTHSLGGVSARDIAMAKKIDTVPTD